MLLRRCRWMLLLLVSLVCLTSPLAANSFTLSDQALLALDGVNIGYSTFTSSLQAVRDIAGPGVDFDIYFPGNLNPNKAFNLLSIDHSGSAGTLVGLPVGAYDHFALQFTLLAINGAPSTNPNLSLQVGAVCNTESSWFSFQPMMLKPILTPTATSSTTKGTVPALETIGFYVSLFPHDSNAWNPNGSLVTLRVTPAPGAVAIPEPLCLLLLAAGGLALRRRRQ